MTCKTKWTGMVGHRVLTRVTEVRGDCTCVYLCEIEIQYITADDREIRFRFLHESGEVTWADVHMDCLRVGFRNGDNTQTYEFIEDVTP